MKNYKMRLETTKTTGKREVKVTDSVEINLADDTSFQEIVEFTEGIKRIYSAAMKASKREAFVKLEITSAVYDNWRTSAAELVQKDFNRWYFDGYNEDTEGIYLMPDTRYTEAHRDLYLTQNVLHDLFTI